MIHHLLLNQGKKVGIKLSKNNETTSAQVSSLKNLN